MKATGHKVLEAMEAGLHVEAGERVYAMSESGDIAVRMARIADGKESEFWSDTGMPVVVFFREVVGRISDEGFATLMADLALAKARRA